jgi:hypothetical protein
MKVAFLFRMKPDEGKNIHKEAEDEIEGKMNSG